MNREGTVGMIKPVHESPEKFACEDLINLVKEEWQQGSKHQSYSLLGSEGLALGEGGKSEDLLYSRARYFFS